MRAWIATVFAACAAFAAQAAEPIDRQLGFQPAATPVMEEVHKFHNVLLLLIIAISFFVLALLIYAMVRYAKSANPTPAKFSHNTFVEIVWTGVPVAILVAISVPSFRLLYLQDTIPPADLTIKAIGYQWYWEYEYPDNDGFAYSSYMIQDAELQPGQKRNLSVDAPVVAPSGATVRVQVTAADVIHNWAMPAFGIKMDGIPGKLNETWFRVEAGKEGTYYGQCSELCGRLHAFMPIQVEIVPQATFDQWAAAKASGEDDRAATILADFKAEAEKTLRLASTTGGDE